MTIVIVFLADHVKEGANGTIVQNDNQGDQDCVKGTHEDIAGCLGYPLKSKWKHGKGPFL